MITVDYNSVLSNINVLSDFVDIHLIHLTLNRYANLIQKILRNETLETLYFVNKLKISRNELETEENRKEISKLETVV